LKKKQGHWKGPSRQGIPHGVPFAATHPLNGGPQTVGFKKIPLKREKKLRKDTDPREEGGRPGMPAEKAGWEPWTQLGRGETTDPPVMIKETGLYKVTAIRLGRQSIKGRGRLRIGGPQRRRGGLPDCSTKNSGERVDGGPE